MPRHDLTDLLEWGAASPATAGDVDELWRRGQRRRVRKRLAVITAGAIPVLLAVIALSVIRPEPAPVIDAPPQATDEWGPLAVRPPYETTEDFYVERVEGTLEVTDGCVALRPDDGRESSLLIWPSDRTSWDPRDRTVAHTDDDGTRVELRDGQRVSLVGGTDTAWADRVNWVSAPAAQCLANLTDAWMVVDIEIEAVPANANDEWGPLAVVAPQQDVMDALIQGTLQVSEECVFLLNENGDRTLMIWSADRTSWEPDDRTITLSGGRELRAGHSGSFGGGHMGGDPSWVDRLEWVSPPAPECLTDVDAWMVAGFQPARDPRIPVPDVTGLTIEEAKARLRSVGFEGSVSHGTYGSDPSGPDAIVVAHEPGAGSLVHPGAVVGFRTVTSAEFCQSVVGLHPRCPPRPTP